MRSSMSEKYNRLSKILDKLYSGEEVTISSLAKEFCTSTKTIQRDLKEKLKSDFLIREGNRFWLKKGKKYDRDAFVANILENFAQEIGGDFEKDTHEILGKLQSHSNHFISPLRIITHKIKELTQIQKAIQSQNQLSFICKNKPYTQISPIELCVVKNGIYLLAYTSTQQRFFWLEDIAQCRLSKQKIHTPNPQTQGKKITLFAYPQAHKYVKSILWGEDQKIWEDGENNLVIEFKCDHEEKIMSEILSQIPHIIVLEPQSLKDRIEQKILAYIKKQESY